MGSNLFYLKFKPRFECSQCSSLFIVRTCGNTVAESAAPNTLIHRLIPDTVERVKDKQDVTVVEDHGIQHQLYLILIRDIRTSGKL